MVVIGEERADWVYAVFKQAEHAARCRHRGTSLDRGSRLDATSSAIWSEEATSSAYFNTTMTTVIPVPEIVYFTVPESYHSEPGSSLKDVQGNLIKNKDGFQS